MPGVPLPKLHGLITIDAASNNLRVRTPSTGAADGTLVTLTSGDYFIRGYTAEGVDQLVEHIQAQVRLVAGFGAFVCTVSDTGFVTMSLGATFDVNWDDEVLRNILGFTVPLAGADTYTAPHQHQFGWYPDAAPSDLSAHSDMSGHAVSDAVVTRARSGRVLTTRYQQTNYVERRLMLAPLHEDYVFPVGSPGVANRDWLTFWDDVLAPGRRCRYYADRTVQASATGGTPPEYVAAERTARQGTEAAERVIANSDRYWRLRMDLLGYVP